MLPQALKKWATLPIVQQKMGSLQPGVKVEMKRRWNYKILWGPYKIFWEPTFLVGPSKICMSKRIYQLFSENINKLITKENDAERCKTANRNASTPLFKFWLCGSFVACMHAGTLIWRFCGPWNVCSGQNNRLFGPRDAYGRIGAFRCVPSYFNPCLQRQQNSMF